MTDNAYHIPGLRSIPEYITLAEQEGLLNTINQQPWLTNLKRRVQHYGYRYDYKRRALPAEMYLGILPDWLLTLAERLHADGLTQEIPNQVIVNEYMPGQGIASHIDCIPCFRGEIVSLSLGSPCVMLYTHTAKKLEVPVLVAPRSLVVMDGEARHEWKHGIPARKTDVYNGQTFRRGTRVSITLRNVIS
ncbi:MAG: alpha-ketoglutarate-dependent dioxygenase AlkB [Aggregatilineales bacterium]